MEPTLEALIALCKKTGDTILPLSGNVEIERKADGSPVTQADRIANDILSEGLKLFDIPILSEESPESFTQHNIGRVWIVDPIDGTSSFMKGEHQWAVMVALVENGTPLMGVVYAPALGVLWSAQRGRGAIRHEHDTKTPMRVSNKNDVHDATLYLSAHHFSDQAKKLAETLGAHVVQMSGLGVKVCKIAQGDAEMYWSEGRFGEWDVCAPHIILEEAGGTMTNAIGEKIIYGSAQERSVPGVAASNGLLHEKLVEAGRGVVA
jgi:3'(2'), 5'-bisphosphate nucleotidase